MNQSAKDKLIVVLDVETAREALELFARLKDVAGVFKIGSQLFTAEGPGIVREIVGAGARVFLDLKFHDIPNTVARAAVEATRLGVSLFTIHACGGSEMMRRTAEAVTETSLSENIARPIVLGITLLTSADENTLAEIGLTSNAATQVERMARLAAHNGLDGAVASPHEVGLVREAVEKRDFVIVTPGVRPAGTSHDDQRRVMTPAEAVRAGADYLVIGRPILKAPDPAIAARKIIQEMEEAANSGR